MRTALWTSTVELARERSGGTLLFDFHAVLTGNEVDELVVSGFVSLCGAPIGSGKIDKRDGGSRYGTARLVGYRAKFLIHKTFARPDDTARR